MRWGLPVLLTLCLLSETPLAFGQMPSLRVYVSNQPTKGGLIGLHLDRTPEAGLPHGISFDYGGQFNWGMGLDATMDYSYPNPPTQVPDLVLAYSVRTNADNLRLRADDARMVLGPRIGHPVLPYQLAISAGTPEAPLGGLSVGAFGDQYSIQLYNRDPALKRTSLNFTNLWTWGTDLAGNGGGDLYLYNSQSNHATLTVSPDDVISLGGTLQHQGTQVGFYGAPPVTQPVVSGSWSDGSAARSLCQALARLGLVQDQTSP